MSTQNSKKGSPIANKPGNILSEMVVKPDDKSPSIGLVSEEDAGPVADSFSIEIEKTLTETEAEVREFAKSSMDDSATWAKSRCVVQRFKPVPWFIWRLANFVLGRPGYINQVAEGLVLGLRRLLFAAAADPFLGSGKKVNHVKTALTILPPDVIAAVAVIHATCRKLASKEFERIWRPILDDALLRAQIGYYAGERIKNFGAGRGMLAGFAGRCGLAILIATGELDQARRALEMLATGADISKVGLIVYGCDPLQISAMTLTASGMGRDAAFGTVAFAYARTSKDVENKEQACWLAAFTIVEKIRVNQEDQIDSSLWNHLGYTEATDRETLIAEAKNMIRRGHTLDWLP